MSTKVNLKCYLIDQTYKIGEVFEQNTTRAGEAMISKEIEQMAKKNGETFERFVQLDFFNKRLQSFIYIITMNANKEEAPHE